MDKNIPVFTRKFIHAHLRTPRESELPCQNPLCESQLIGGHRLIALVGRWCYICNLSHTNRLYFESLNRKTDEIIGSPIHKFTILTDVIGEFRLDACLNGDKNVRGLFGTFLLYSKYNYHILDGGKKWVEADRVCFGVYPSGIKSDQVLLSHPSGEGEYLQPIKPYWMTSSTFEIPTIEESLLIEFEKKRHHRQISSYIFRSSIELSRIKLQTWIDDTNFSLAAASDLCKSRIEIQRFLNDNQDRANMHQFARMFPQRDYISSKSVPTQVEGNPPAWTSRFKLSDIDKLSNYSYFATVWIRIVCTQSLIEYCSEFKHEKAIRFMNAHIPVVRYLDSLDDPRDECINIQLLCSLYQQLGESRYDEDRNLIKVHTERFQIREYPLEILERTYPSHRWRIEQNQSANLKHIEDASYGLPNMLKNHILLASLSIMVQCKDLHEKEKDPLVRDALWFYHLCFLDYVSSDPIGPPTPLVYPFDNRCFTGYDLPDAFHVLSGLPLFGEQMIPFSPLGKFIQKSLPFAGARRTLIDQTDKIVGTDEAFWRLFSAVFYCLLLDTFPEHVSKNRQRCFNLPRLISMQELVTNKSLLRESLSRKSYKSTNSNFNKENDKGCYIVFTAFRMWMMLLAHEQFHYQRAIQSCVDWPLFEQQIVEMAAKIRDTFGGTDVWAESREYLSKNSKNSKTRVYRYRKSNAIDTILEKMMESLEKQLFKELDSWEKSASALFSNLAERVKFSLSAEVPVHIKTNILNTLIRIPKEEWLTPKCLSIMRSPELGGISDISIALILKLIDVYFNSAKPQEFEKFISLFDTQTEFKVVSWYFHVLNIINKIDFEPLPSKTIDQIDESMMTVRYVLYPGQDLPMTAYNVFFTICCGKIKTLTGFNEYGHENIAYDMNRNIYVCAKSQKKAVLYNSDDFAFSEFEKQKKNARKQRKDFNYMPCKDNPVLCISLRGFMLIYDKDQRYLHCPSCAAFHRFEWTGYKDDMYKCSNCRLKERSYYTTCHVCGCEASLTGTVECMKNVYQNVYFCKKHVPKT